MLPYRSAPGIPCVRFALRKGRGCLNRGLRGLRRWAVMPRAVLSRSLSVSGIARVV